MMLQNELVSIITPSYNTEKFIDKTIQSVLKQTYKNWEMIIIDDCSTDNTDQIVAKFNDSRIKYIKNKKNLGAAISRNKALREAKGKWIAFLDSDDLWVPEKLEKQISFMNKNQYSFSYSRYREIDEEGNDLGIEICGPQKINKRIMYNYCWPGCLTVMYDAEKVGVIQIKDIKKNNDYALWLQVIKKTNCYLCDIPLAMYRKRTGSISNQGYMKLIKWHYKLFKEIDGRSFIWSLFFTIRNLVFGFWKKVHYVKK
ncbi:glycosyltransferase family 2 protein [Clostridium perfringens]|uniref:glycosyltransferase family 2 protein n=1 Tax=Clostridium perfringens TaxID=1502 RepID=UPI0021F9A730|nr:glycosyltransferase family 2 protein [Clostridium perfringens]MDK0762768.1 glycosyltransferase family 2 protein [Clostridium perfringens]MDO6337121.1 glycosyltransferase family 2 protein [Clostridium perfringens]BDS16269.1 glycosyl transferase [Clostridium perfringens]